MNPMMQTKSLNPNPMQKSLVPMLHSWTRFISWTIVISAATAVLLALALDGCSHVH